MHQLRNMIGTFDLIGLQGEGPSSSGPKEVLQKEELRPYFFMENESIET